jgi:hypothetical protein
MSNRGSKITEVVKDGATALMLNRYMQDVEVHLPVFPARGCKPDTI